MRDVVMAIFGLTHTINTKVGNDFIRGVSGGERKRVSIAEVALSGSPLQCWDNSTRGLDSATALEFVKSVRLSSKYTGSTALGEFICLSFLLLCTEYELVSGNLPGFPGYL
jgi:ATP-binding cassette, subfamily G (WHITE), member 2, PDR